MEEADKFDRIEKYLDDALNEKERKAFEQELEEDEKLKAELALHQDLSSTLKSEKLHNFRALLKKTDKEWSASQPEAKRRSLFPRVIGAIAAAVMLLLLAYQFLRQPTSLSPADLFAENYVSYNMVLKERSGSTDALTQELNNAVAAYNSQDFDQAASLFNHLYEKTQEQLAYQFYAAQSELGANRIDESIVLFSNLLQQNDHPFVEQSRWYLALAYLKKGAVPEAKLLLQEIKIGQFNYKKAETLLKSAVFKS